MSLYLLDTFRFPTIGEVEFACSETEYLWRVPVGVTSITCVLIGGGGGGRAGANQQDGAGGGGGALRWVNNMVVVPGETLRIKVGLGGTGCSTRVVATAGRDIAWGRPGQDSYIASDNNASVPARAGIGGTIIVEAEGGGWNGYLSDSVRIRASNSELIDEMDGTLNTNQVRGTSEIGNAGGQGTAFGNYTWGTVGGGDGGEGGAGDGIGGGQDGGGGGAGGYGGNGGHGGTASILNSCTSGSGGSGGGGLFGAGGGADGGGGGGGVGVYWGAGPNGIRGGTFWNGSAIEFNDNKSNTPMAGSGGQAGSFGADGKATGCDLIDPVNYIESVTPITNYPNASEGNGKRGFNSSVDDVLDEDVVIGNGGLYGGGGGAAQTGGSASGQAPRSGDGACGRVRILWAVRTDRVFREYDAGRGNIATRTRRGQNISVEFYDWNTSQNVSSNISNGWPSWDPTPGVSYNLLTNWAVNVPTYSYVLTGGGSGTLTQSTSIALPQVVSPGISSNPSNYPI